MLLDELRLGKIVCTTALEVELLAALVAERRKCSRLLKPPNPPNPPKVQTPEPPLPEPEPIQDAPALLPLDQLVAREANMRQIMRAVCEVYGISRHDMCNDRRHVYLVMARHTAFVLCHMLSRKSYPEIGRLYGDRDHTTVLNGVRKLAWLKSELGTELSANDTLVTWVRTAHSKMMRRYMKDGGPPRQLGLYLQPAHVREEAVDKANTPSIVDDKAAEWVLHPPLGG